MNEELSDEYWGAQTPVRLLFLFVLTAYTYTFKKGGMLAARSTEYMMDAGTTLNNSIVFTWGFLEMAAWFWVFVTLREERREKARKIVEKRQAEAARL
jgi:cyanate permease|tara:strand:- start:970 stop:1263 length:294 start_codon:yes stop_codon:yes gene_type:complete